MTEQEVVELMRGSKTRAEWDSNCDKVKAACDGYPEFWYQAILASGLAATVSASFGSDAEIHITTS